MAKPQLIGTISWTTGSALNAVLGSYTSAAIVAKDVFAKKIYGFRNIRGTMVVRLEHNADPFQQGRVLLHFLPMTKVFNNFNNYVDSHNYNLTTKTQQPGVELDCRDAACQLKVPYIAPTQWYDIQTGNTDWGTLYVSVISPLEIGSGGTANVDISVFVHFENFEASAPVYPNANGKASKIKSVTKANMRFDYDEDDHADEDISEEPIYDFDYNEVLKSQASNNRVKEKSTMGKSISSALNAVGKVATLAAGVPALTSLAAPVAWAAGAASSVASAFGWSKPNTDSVAAPMIIRPFRTFGNAEGASTAETMAISAVPTLGVMPGFAGTDVDEMAFDHIKAIPAYTHTIPWSTSNATDASLYTKEVGINSFITNTSIIAGLYTNEIKTGPPFAIISELFNSFRGGVVITLKFVKTEFHSGRLLLTYTPTHVPSTAPPTNDQSSYALREIIDIRENSQISFTLPYMLAQTYTSTDIGTMGRLDIRVLNVLRAPSTAPTAIDINVYYHAAPDYELQCSTNYELMPVTPQAGVEVSEVVKTVGNATPGSTNMSTSSFCASESFMSLKQLITRYSRVYMPSGTDIVTGEYYSIYPFFLSGAASLGSAEPTVPHLWGDTLSLLASAYALSRGGVRFAFTSTSASKMTVTTRHMPAPTQWYNTTGIQNFVFPTDTSNIRIPGTAAFAGPIAVFNDLSDGAEILIPHQTTAPVRPNIFFTTTGESLVSAPVAGVSDIYMTMRIAPAPTDVQLYRSAADDYQLGYFIGFPALLYRHYLT
jgi:hypothetical protein